MRLSLTFKAFTVLLLAVLIWGCPLKLRDKNSGDDKDRKGAVELAVNTVVTDDLNGVKGDHTDWKVFSLPEDGGFTLKLGTDNPDVEMKVKLRDHFGEIIKEFDHKKGETMEVWGPFGAKKEKYFLEISVGDLSGSVYSIKVDFKAQSVIENVPSPE